MANEPLVMFKRGTLDQYSELASVNENSFYALTDTGDLRIGTKGYSNRVFYIDPNVSTGESGGGVDQDKIAVLMAVTAKIKEYVELYSWSGSGNTSNSGLEIPRVYVKAYIPETLTYSSSAPSIDQGYVEGQIIVSNHSYVGIGYLTYPNGNYGEDAAVLPNYIVIKGTSVATYEESTYQGGYCGNPDDLSSNYGLSDIETNRSPSVTGQFIYNAIAGAISQGTGLTIVDDQGAKVINVDMSALTKASTSDFGIIKVTAGNGLGITNGVISMALADTNPGAVKPSTGNGLTYNSSTGALAMGLATGSGAGAVKTEGDGNSNGLNIANGVIKVVPGNGIQLSSNTVAAKVVAPITTDSSGIKLSTGTGLTVPSTGTDANKLTVDSTWLDTQISTAIGSVDHNKFKTITGNTGSTVASGQTDTLAIEGTGLISTSVDNGKVTISTTAEVNQNAFSTIAVSGEDSVVADQKTDTLTFAGAGGLTITTDATNDTITFTAPAAQTIAEGSTNGTIAVNGTDVSVHGLGSAAYTDSTAYATSAQGDKADAAMPKAGGTFTGNVDFGSGKTLTVNAPTADGHAATKKYVDDSVAGLTGAMHFLGVSTTAITDGGTENPTINGEVVTTKASGDVVIYEGKEFVWGGAAWELFGDEGSYALKTITVTGTDGLSGGGAISSNVQISHAAPGTGSALTPASGSGRTYITEISIDSKGHVTGAKSATETVVNTDEKFSTSVSGNNTAYYITAKTDANKASASVGTYLPLVATTNADHTKVALTGVSTIDGTAAKASKINVSEAIGGATQGVYIAADGTVTAVDYTVSKDVPSDAKFTDTVTTIAAGASNTSGKTVATLVASNGAITQTYQDISITASQVSDFDTAVDARIALAAPVWEAIA